MSKFCRASRVAGNLGSVAAHFFLCRCLRGTVARSARFSKSRALLATSAAILVCAAGRSDRKHNEPLARSGEVVRPSSGLLHAGSQRAPLCNPPPSVTWRIPADHRAPAAPEPLYISLSARIALSLLLEDPLILPPPLPPTKRKQNISRKFYDTYIPHHVDSFFFFFFEPTA